MTPYRILYNARCPICRAEITQYHRQAQSSGAPLVFEDLNSVDLAEWHLNPDQAARRLHALAPDGTLHSGIDAFAIVWSALPKLNWLARLARLPVIGGILRLVYNHVAAPLLYHRQKRRDRRARQALG